MRSKSYILETILKMLPKLEKYSNSKRVKTVNSFQEIIQEPNTLLEIEDHNPGFVYILLDGVIDFYKRAESLYDVNGRRVDSSDIPHMTNPVDSGNQKIGLKISSVKQPALLCEDAVIFN